MAKRHKQPPEQIGEKLSYDRTKIVDAPEFYELSRAFGILTWESWDNGRRPVEERIHDFILAFPPDNPVVRTRGCLMRQPDGSYAPGTIEMRLQRFEASDWRPGSLHELLARYGLKLIDGPAPPATPRLFVPGAFREIARRRNQKLRVLHGGVDVEPADMDAAKADFLESQEKQQAAQELRAALKRMRGELER